MKKILAVLIAALIICLSVVPAMAVFPVGDALYFVGQCIELYNTSAQIHEAYADTIQKAMDYRKYYNEQGLAKAYDKMQVSMRNLGTSTYNTVLNTTNKTFYDIRNNFKFTYNTAYYNQTYNSYYIPVTYNDVDYNYFITYAPTYTTAVAAADKARANNSFKPSSVYFSSFPLNRETWYNISIVNDGTQIKWYREGVPFTPPDGWNVSNGCISSVSLSGVAGLTYSCYDELRISKGALYSGEYTPHVGPFDVPTVLVTPDISAVPDGTVAVKSAVSVANFRVGGVRPSYPVEGSVYISLDADKKVTSCQQYQSGTWTECQGSVCKDGNWVELTGYSFAGQVVNEDDFAEVIDKKDDPAIGSNSNPDAEVTSFTVHYYKDGTTDKLRRDTVYQNVAVGSSFTFSPPAIKNYKPLVSSAEITISADGEHIFYYAADAGSGGSSGGESDPSKPGFFDGLLSGVKSLVNVVCGFLGGVVQSVLSGITGIISTLIEAFKAVLSLGGHFGDFLAAALGFVPREIIDLLIAGIAVSIALAIVKFIRG